MSKDKKIKMTYIGRRLKGYPNAKPIHVWLHGNVEHHFVKNWKRVWLGYTYEFEVSNGGKTFQKGERTEDDVDPRSTEWAAADRAVGEHQRARRAERELAALPGKKLDEAMEPLLQIYLKLENLEQHHFVNWLSDELYKRANRAWLAKKMKVSK